MHGGLLYKLLFPNTLSLLSIKFPTMINNAPALNKFLGKIQSSAVVYKAEDEDYFIGGGMGFKTIVKHKMEISDSKPTSNPSSKKVRIVRIEEVDFCTDFVGGVPGSKICGLTKGGNGSCNNYKTHGYQDKGNVESAFYITINGTNLFLKPLV